MKNLIIGVLFILILGSCKKILNPSEPEHYISGHLYSDCGGTPIKNRGLYIYREGLRGAGETTKGTCTTDSNGYFKMIYRANNAGEPLEVRFANSNYDIVYLPGNPIVNIDNAKLYGVSTCNITVKLNVTNPRTSSDTLVVDDARNPGATVKVAGPFVNGYTVYTANNFNLLVPDITGKKLDLGFYLNTPIFNSKPFTAEACKNNIVTIDIN
jgi:hypothetical protein